MTGRDGDDLLCDEHGRAYVFEDRGEASAFALKMDFFDVRGLGDANWEVFQHSRRHVFLKKGSHPALAPPSVDRWQ